MDSIEILSRMQAETTSITDRTALADGKEAISYHSTLLSDTWSWDCPRCGERLIPSMRYCPKCGQLLAEWKGYE